MTQKTDSMYDEMIVKLKDILHKNVVTVRFVKESTGETREMVCTLVEKYLPEKKAPAKDAPVKAPRKQNPDVCVVFDLQREEWRSFRYDSVIEFSTIEGVYVPKTPSKVELVFTPNEV